MSKKDDDVAHHGVKRPISHLTDDDDDDEGNSTKRQKTDRFETDQVHPAEQHISKSNGDDNRDHELQIVWFFCSLPLFEKNMLLCRICRGAIFSASTPHSKLDYQRLMRKKMPELLQQDDKSVLHSSLHNSYLICSTLASLFLEFHRHLLFRSNTGVVLENTPSVQCA